MKVIGFNEIIDLNHQLAEEKLNFKIHLRDACGKQSLWIEPLGQCACDGKYDKLYEFLENYFDKLRYQITFDDDKLNFWIQ